MTRTIRVGLGAGMPMVLLVGLLAGCGTSSLLQGNEAFHRGDYAAAEAHWKPRAESGDVHAQHNLGVLNNHLGNSEIAAFWWEQAVAREFVPSMLELGTLKLAAGEHHDAETLYRRAARWGNSDAIALLEALEKPVPHADLWLAEYMQAKIRRTRMILHNDRRRSAEEQQDVIDHSAALAANDD